MLFGAVGLLVNGFVSAATETDYEDLLTPPSSQSPLRASLNPILMDTAPPLPLSSHITSISVKARDTLPSVPFYSQFTDISSPRWQKVGCGIASLAMIIDYYNDSAALDVDSLLNTGISSGAYNSDAGWSHAGLISLAGDFKLTGASHSLAHLSATAAFAELEEALDNGPVMVSVHYTFEPTNPIPHLVVVNRVSDDKIYYNDPAEENGDNSISIEKFKRAWKQRYIELRPTV